MRGVGDSDTHAASERDTGTPGMAALFLCAEILKGNRIEKENGGWKL